VIRADAFWIAPRSVEQLLTDTLEARLLGALDQHVAVRTSSSWMVSTAMALATSPRRAAMPSATTHSPDPVDEELPRCEAPSATSVAASAAGLPNAPSNRRVVSTEQFGREERVK